MYKRANVVDNRLDAGQIVRLILCSLDQQPGDLFSPSDVVEALRRNKVPLLSLAIDRGSLAPREVQVLRDSVAFREALGAEAAHYAAAHAEYVRLAQCWAQHAIPCLCFKAAGLVPAFPYTSDNIDLLVPAPCAAPARQLLRTLGYVEMTNTEEPQKWLFRRFVAGRNVSLIHLHARVAWDEGFLCEEALWQRRRPAPDDPWVWLPGREDAVLINLAHALIENKALSLHDLLKVRAALGAPTALDWAYLEAVAARRGWADTLHLGLLLVAQLETQLFGHSRVPAAVQAAARRALPPWLRAYARRVQGRPPRLPFALSFAVSKGLFFTKLWGDRELAGRAKPAQTGLALARGVKERTGLHLQNAMLITLSGVDGAGKSSQAEALQQAFAVSHVRSRIVWTRVGATPLLRVLHRVRKRLARTDSGRLAVSGQRSFSRGHWKLRLWAVVASVDYAVWLLYVRWRLLRGDVVIADRYLHDFEIEFGIRLQKQPRLA
jgi:hypothetical protein